ncbi:hypothetical protein [Paludibaculum fermentans]|uniref:NHL repeat containing protein n=1 Tax=Paludibaculum fermentans TaxID=1473598 RepID=A0A7S7SM52_PALFE|nr:hypothetical protein [Paludibaculum fermentans]QOY90084.1 hypothetical protein IRI77_09060 [Paludibaculum fermentans]
MLYPPSSSPNRTKAKSLYSPYSVAVDAASSPAAVYVADTGNHRVLGWRDSANFTSGAPADLVIGQKDFDSAVPYGAAVRISESSTNVYDLQALKDYGGGLRTPSSVVIIGDYLFVMDAGNNRIVRFRRPFESLDAGTAIKPDLVIGQPDLKSNLANQSSTANAAPTASTLKTNLGSGGIQTAGLAVDGSGNLWVADSGNHRILRYTTGDVTGPSNVDGGTASISADLVLGQTDFNTVVANAGRYSSATDQLSKTTIRYGGPLTFDSNGNLYFADDLARVLVWGPPFTNGKAASRILGIYAAVKGAPALPAVNDLTFGFSLAGTTVQNAVFTGGPRGLFCIGENLFVIDSLNHRIVRYDPPSSWPAEDLPNGVFSPHMTNVYGQNDFSTRYQNTADNLEPNPWGYNAPVAAAYANGEIYITEIGNHRVTVRPFDSAARTFGAATRILGQFDFPFKAPNFIEGSEFSGGTIPSIGVSIGPSVAIDRTSDVPRLFIADTGNNRILCFADARNFTNQSRADVILGQVDSYRSLVNSPFNNPATPGPDGLYIPADVKVDPQGNVWVADTGNGRVLRYPNPFTRTDGLLTPDLVLGAPDFTSTVATQVARDRMYLPSGLAFTPEGNLAVADLGLHRVLLFKQPSVSGQTADIVFGQVDGTSYTAGNLAEQLNSPRGIAIDSFGRLFVADTGNSRIQIWDDVNSAYSDGLPSQFALPAGAVGVPISVTIDPKTEAIWVAESSNLNRIMRFPSYAELLGSGSIASNFSLQVAGPRGVVLDGRGNPMVMDSASRLTMYYPRLTVVNAANGFSRVAPAMLGQLRVQGATLSADGASASGSPLPTNLGDVEVLVNGVNAPLTKAATDNVTLIVPKGTAPSGTAEFLVRQVSTGQILGFDRISMSPISPGIMFQGDAIYTTGPAMALNQDGSENSASKPAKIDQTLTVFLTGYGNFDGLPDDGLAPGSEAPIPGDVLAYLLLGTGATQAQVVSSTLDPDKPGVWRVKVKVPTTLNNGTYTVNIVYKSTPTLIPPGSSTIQVRPYVVIAR